MATQVRVQLLSIGHRVTVAIDHGLTLTLVVHSLVSELIPKLRFHYISLHWVSDYLPLSLVNQERF